MSGLRIQKSLQEAASPSNNVVITTGMLNLLNDRELNAFFGHELGHRKNGDGQDRRAEIVAYFSQRLRFNNTLEQRETLADDRAVEAAYASHLYSPDDLISGLTKFTAAGKAAGHDTSAMDSSPKSKIEGALNAALPEKALVALNSVADFWAHALGAVHLTDHPSLEHRIENISEQKQLHDKGGLKR